jgi:hypothetical protein
LVAKITKLTGVAVSRDELRAWIMPTSTGHLIPLEFVGALVAAAGDNELIDSLAAACGLFTVDRHDIAVILLLCLGPAELKKYRDLAAHDAGDMLMPEYQEILNAMKNFIGTGEKDIQQWARNYFQMLFAQYYEERHNMTRQLQMDGHHHFPAR